MLPVRSIWILADNLFPDDRKLHSFRCRDTPGGIVLCPDQHIVTLELRKWGDLSMIETDLDRWAWFLRNADRIDPDNPPEPMLRSGVEEAMAAMKVWTKEQVDVYQADKELREELLYNTIRNVAMEKGLAEGMEKGLAEGKVAALREVAGKLKAKGMSDEEIAGLTGLHPACLDERIL